jgi:hypothetical protein
MSDPDRDDDLILAAAAMFHAAAMQQLGKLVDPSTGKAEVDLQQARLSIDVLGALQAKTEGHLHPQAAAELERLLFQLRMGFLDESRRIEAAGAAADGLKPAASDAPAPPREAPASGESAAS